MIVARRGTVGAGAGRATGYISRLDLGPVVGWTPVPGTLNVRFDRPVRIGEPRWVVASHRLWLAQVAHVPAAIIRWPWDRRVWSYELIGPVRFRDELGLADGHTINVHIWAGEGAIMPEGTIWVAKRSFATVVDGKKVMVKGGKTRVREGHQLLAENPDRFEPLTVHFDVEQTTAAPGERRQVTRKKTTVKQTDV